MIDKTNSASWLSLRAAGRYLLLLAVAYTLVAAGFTAIFLTKIENEARLTREIQIPLILSQTRNAVKVERLSSLVRAIFLARDRQVERQIQLQIQALAQSFAFDGSAVLVTGSKRAAELGKTIAVSHQQNRDTDDALRQSDFERDAKDAYGEAMKVLDGMAKEVSGDAAVVANDLTEEIQRGAANTRIGVLILVLAPGIFSIVILALARRHLAAPILEGIRNLGKIGEHEVPSSAARPPVLSELALIGNAIVAYGQAAHELRRKNAVLQALSEEDPLTGLANRRTFERILLSSAASLDRTHGTALLMIDIDHFKSINDFYGHPTGDRCLQNLGTLLRDEEVIEGVAARYGGEEFAIVLDSKSADDALEFAQKLCKRIANLKTTTTDDNEISFTASIGVAYTADATTDIAAIIERADKALYLAKHAGRNQAISDSQLSVVADTLRRKHRDL